MLIVGYVVQPPPWRDSTAFLSFFVPSLLKSFCVIPISHQFSLSDAQLTLCHRSLSTLVRIAVCLWLMEKLATSCLQCTTEACNTRAKKKKASDAAHPLNNLFDFEPVGPASSAAVFVLFSCVGRRQITFFFNHYRRAFIVKQPQWTQCFSADH